MTKYVCFFLRAVKQICFGPIWEPKYRWVKSEVFESLWKISVIKWFVGGKRGINSTYVRQFFQMKGHQCPLAEVHLFSILMLENIGHIAEYFAEYHTDQKMSHLLI